MRPGRLGLLLAAAAGTAALATAASQRRAREALLAAVRCRAGPIDAQAAHGGRLGDNGLPPPVARYLERALPPERRRIRLARYAQTGSLRTDPASRRWRRFSAEQVIAAASPAFAWTARVALAPLLHVRVQDGLLDGVGSGEVLLLSAFPLARARGTAPLNSGALHRFLAEAVWCPTALLPGPRLRWQPIDDARALATLTDRDTSVSLEFRFGPRGEVRSVYTPGRWASFGAGGYRQLPWEGRFHAYAERQGVLVPTEAEVGWYLGGDWCGVWQGRITRAAFE